jgi:hypothetical protein
VVETLEAAALAFPIADRIVDEIQLRDAAKIRNRKNGIEDGLQSRVLPFRGKQIHLQKSLVGSPLNLNEIRDLYDCRYFGEIDALADSAIAAVKHSRCSLPEISKPCRTILTQHPY